MSQHRKLNTDQKRVNWKSNKVYSVISRGHLHTSNLCHLICHFHISIIHLFCPQNFALISIVLIFFLGPLKANIMMQFLGGRGGGGGWVVGCNYRRRLFFMVCDSIQTQQQEWMSMKLLLMTLLNR